MALLFYIFITCTGEKMSNLMGIPTKKGNSQEIISVKFDTALLAAVKAETWGQGQAVMLASSQDGTAMPTVSMVSASTDIVEGFLIATDSVRGFGTIVKRGSLVPLDAAEEITAAGAVYVDPTTGKPTATSTDTIAIGARFVLTGASVVDASGTEVTYPCHIDLREPF